MTAHAALRDATRQAHDRLDRRFSALNLASIVDYGDFLRAHAAAFLPVEHALERSGAAALIAGWHDIKRGNALKSDLHALGVASPTPENAPDFEQRAELLGGLYVLEGSRLGGKILYKAVGSGFPTRFLASRAPVGHWRSFVAMLEEMLYSDGDRATAGATAVRTFECFERAAGRVLTK
ncbi:biliverdin-producing heme oxygenase [Sphingomonas edaphi]|uniref:Heme oxygenase n=1 Tax=Sphingomonas edaphi TaxID=2315689 RepID=A0A418Q0L0_9SPHN|nr:biliverdin-producing heme oxygenase [Sphingomonas edaphi]RIX29416.1 heme oxygenase [Sphingomonas edaphi]